MQGLQTAQDLADAVSAPMTFQQRWWWNNCCGNAAWHYTMACALRISGHLDLELLRKGIAAVTRRHDSLRSRIVMRGDVPEQRFDPVYRHGVQTSDLPEGAHDIDTRLRHAVSQLLQTRMDLAQGPLFKARLIRVAERDQLLVLLIDHTIADRTSLSILLQDLWCCYSQGGADIAQLDRRTFMPYAEYSAWQHAISRDWTFPGGPYWQARLAGTSPAPLPIESVAAARPQSAGFIPLQMGEALSAGLRNLAKRERSMLSMVVLAIQVAQLSRWCRTRDLMVSFVEAGRHTAALARTVGYFAYPMHLRLQLAADETCRQLLQRVTKEYSSAWAHPEFGSIAIAMPEYLNRVWIQWNQSPAVSAATAASDRKRQGNAPAILKVAPFRFERPRIDAPSNFGIALGFADQGRQITGTCHYRADYFAPDTMEKFCSDLLALAQRFCENPLQRFLALADG